LNVWVAFFLTRPGCFSSSMRFFCGVGGLQFFLAPIPGADPTLFVPMLSYSLDHCHPTKPSHTFNTSPQLNQGRFPESHFRLPYPHSCPTSLSHPQIKNHPFPTNPQISPLNTPTTLPLFPHTYQYRLAWLLRSFPFSLS